MRFRPTSLLTVLTTIPYTLQSHLQVGPAATGSFSSSDLKIARPPSSGPLKRAYASSNPSDRAANAIESWWFYDQSPDGITALLAENNARPISIRVEDPTGPTFAGSMVINSGDYYSASWWWYYGFNPTGLSNLLNGKTLISLDPYQNVNGLVFVAVMLPDTVTWWWYYGLAVSAVNTNLVANNARLISARPYLNSGQVVYAVIMVSNAANPVQSQWTTAQSLTALTNSLNSNSSVRLLALAPNPTGGWDSITIPGGDTNWWWWTGLDTSTVTSNIQAHGSLIIDLSSSLNNGVRVYAGVEIGSGTNPSQPSPSPSPSPSPPPIPSSSKSQSQTKIIAGAVSGVVGLAIFALVAALLYRRKRKVGRKEPLNEGESTKLSSPAPDSGHTMSEPVEPGGSVHSSQPMSQGDLRPISQMPVVPGWAPPLSSQSTTVYGYVPPTDAAFLPYVGSNVSPSVSASMNSGSAQSPSPHPEV